jgi:hypothetical protein
MSEARFYLNADVLSNSTGALHAVTGTAVTVLSKIEEHTRVVNVVDMYGNRFPVRVDKLSPHPVLVEEAEPTLMMPEPADHYKLSFVFH